ncbi:hypothetical protein HOLleu_39418 [Holothuria leucospilota]|uniref:DDE Tnp4 domain-containing protein n=1 Tax=Holothuria leucospilota TaxID=206669 RepID=A0A9Q1BBT4_HOLLE|nr:hypothetical protein HOLleu_39418 [Holothuria leucospilota]
MALVDVNYKFINTDVRGYGRNSDGGVFANSPLGRHLKANTLNIPMDEPLRGAPGNDVPFVIIGDEAFPLIKNLIRPFPNVGLKEERHIFNYMLSRARRVVENAFGILVCRWCVFHTKIIVSLPNVNKIVKASCVLHNFLQTVSTPMQNATITAESNSSETNY